MNLEAVTDTKSLLYLAFVGFFVHATQEKKYGRHCTMHTARVATTSTSWSNCLTNQQINKQRNPSKTMPGCAKFQCATIEPLHHGRVTNQSVKQVADQVPQSHIGHQRFSVQRFPGHGTCLMAAQPQLDRLSVVCNSGRTQSQGEAIEVQGTISPPMNLYPENELVVRKRAP